MQSSIAEISDYLKYGEYSLAARRILDAAYDTGNMQLLQQAIKLSRSREAGNPQAFAEQAAAFIKTLDNESLHTKTPRELVRAQGISKTYNTGHFTLQDSSLKLDTGDIIGIVGENGNGKTTLLRLLSGQLMNDGGSITYNGKQESDYYDLRGYIAFVPQRIPRWYGFLKDNLHFSAAISGYTGDKNDTMVDYVIERFGLAPYAHLTWDQISSGYRTRFEIARILLQKPSLLILDEPLANLDIKAQQSILEDLKMITKSSGHNMGIILSSQQLHEVEKVADNVIMLSHGKQIYARTQQAVEEQTNVSCLELETSATREQLVQALNGECDITFTGGYYMIESSTHTIPQLIMKLASSGIPITYLRDITHSTKQLFNKL